MSLVYRARDPDRRQQHRVRRRELATQFRTIGGRSQSGAAASLLVVDFCKLLIPPPGRSGLRQRLAIGGDGQRALIHVLAVFLPAEIDAARAVLRDHARPPGRPHRARGGIILAVEFGIADTTLVTERYSETVASL